MRIGFIISLSVSLLGTVVSLQADSLDSALNHLDRAGAQFKSMSAQFQNIKHTALVNLDSTSTGGIKLKRPKPGTFLAFLDYVQPDKKLVSLNDQMVDIYLPNVKTDQWCDLGKHKDLLQQFFLFGFGTSRRDLEASYNVSYGGPDTINGEASTRLVLTSKSPDIAKHLSKFELWISDKTGEPLRQEFYEPSGDYNVFTYSDMKINPNLPDSSLKLPHLKGDVKKENICK
jgi:outer membrane lipoprotein-sorting protein